MRVILMDIWIVIFPFCTHKRGSKQEISQSSQGEDTDIRAEHLIDPLHLAYENTMWNDGTAPYPIDSVCFQILIDAVANLTRIVNRRHSSGDQESRT